MLSINLGEGRGQKYIARINKSLFIEELVNKYGFVFGEQPSETNIRNIVENNYSEYISDFEKGVSL